MAEDLYMGVDIGTTGIRAAIFEKSGSEKGYSYQEYPMITTQQGMAELDPELIFHSFMSVVKNSLEQNNISGASIIAIGLSTQMHSFMAVDKNGDKLTNLITWADTRSLEDVEYIDKNLDCKELYMKTGCRANHSIYYISKIMWMKRSMTEQYQKTAKFVSIKEYILHKFYGVYLIDITDASTTACFNIHNFAWDADILTDILGVDRNKFGDSVDCDYILKGMKEKYARLMGLDSMIPVVIGSGDGIMANLGCGGIDSTTMSCTIGTSGAMRIAVDKPLLDEKQRTWCYCFTRKKWVAGGAINNGGIVLRWLRDDYQQQFEHEVKQFNQKNIYKLFDYYVSVTKPGSDGLIFLPFLTGERSPGWNADASAFICGLKITHDKRHIVRAAMEGILFNMFSIYEILSNLDGNVQKIVANGGYVKSDVWLQMQADIFNKEISVAPIGEASVWGAAYTAMVALGAVKGFDAPMPVMKPERVIKPEEENHRLYREVYKRYQGLYFELINKK